MMPEKLRPLLKRVLMLNFQEEPPYEEIIQKLSNFITQDLWGAEVDKVVYDWNVPLLNDPPPSNFLTSPPPKTPFL